MELPRINLSDQGVLGGLKARLGFPVDNHSRDDYNDRGYDGAYDDNYEDDYNEGYADHSLSYGRSAEGYDVTVGTGYDRQESASSRPTYGDRGRVTTRAAGISTPRLVTMDDVRASTQIPESLNRDPLPARQVSSLGTRRNVHTISETATTNSPNTPAARAAAAASRGRERSESLNSLFVPPASDSMDESSFSSETSTGASSTKNSFDPYAAYAGAGVGKHSPTRSFTVLKPINYGEVERIAKALKAGDAVVLALRSTPDSLSKRILDFAFGVSSALDASVDCVADKVFVITRGAALSDTEKTSLRNQGVL